MANILTDAAATYAAATVLATTKVDSEVRTDAESDEIAIASWFTEIDNAVKNVNAFLVGSQPAGRAGNTTALLGALSVAQALSAASAAIVGAVTAASATLGDGTGTPTLTLNKVATGQARIDLKDAGVLRWREAMDGGENFVIERYDASGVIVDTPITIDDATGAITTPSTINGINVTTIEAIDTSGFTNCEGAWHFDGDVTDSSGNAYHLVASGATARYVMLQGKQAICCWSALRLDEAAGPGNSPLLQITGALTVHCLVWISTMESSAESYLFAFGGSGETLATNHLYAIKIKTTGEVQFFGEYGSGSDTTGSFEAVIPIGKWTLVSLTRNAAGTGIKLYFDGTLIASLTLANAAAGGTTSEMYLQDTQCHYGGIVVCADEQDAAEVLAVAEQVGVV